CALPILHGNRSDHRGLLPWTRWGESLRNEGLGSDRDTMRGESERPRSDEGARGGTPASPGRRRHRRRPDSAESAGEKRQESQGGRRQGRQSSAPAGQRGEAPAQASGAKRAEQGGRGERRQGGGRRPRRTTDRAESASVLRGPRGRLRVIPLGGVGEIGKNMTAVEYEDEIILLDCGAKFPEEEQRGIDLIVPDVTYVRERREIGRASCRERGQRAEGGGTAGTRGGAQ